MQLFVVKNSEPRHLTELTALKTDLDSPICVGIIAEFPRRIRTILYSALTYRYITSILLPSLVRLTISHTFLMSRQRYTQLTYCHCIKHFSLSPFPPPSLRSSLLPSPCPHPTPPSWGLVFLFFAHLLHSVTQLPLLHLYLNYHGQPLNVSLLSKSFRLSSQLI